MVKVLQRMRQLHSTVAPIVLLPLLVTVTTGIAYRLGKSWGGLSRDQVHWLMTLHEGEYLGAVGEPLYVLLNGLGLLWMLITGGIMAAQNLRRAWGRWRGGGRSRPTPNPTPTPDRAPE